MAQEEQWNNEDNDGIETGAPDALSTSPVIDAGQEAWLVPAEPDSSEIDTTQSERAIPSISEEGQTPVSDNTSMSKSRLGDTFTRVTLGSALIGLDAVTERLEQVAEAESQAVQEPRSLDSVLIPMSEWKISFGEPADHTARYLMLGMIVDAKNKGQRSSRVIRRLSDMVFNIAGAVLNPILRSKPASPAQSLFNRAVQRGESQVQNWIELGRQTDLKSRSSAELALNQTAEEAMDEIIDNERIHVFIQDVVQAQSMGIVDEAIEEIRERSISADNFIEAPFRSILRRPRRREIPAPDFDPQKVRAYSKRNLPIKEGSLLGYYAGFISRLLAFALDVLFLTIILALGGWLLTTSINLLGLDAFFTPLLNFDESTSSTTSLLFGLNGLIILLAYFIIFWVLTGQTLGMMILGIRVVTYSGEPLKFWNALLRLIGMFIASFLLFLGYFWVVIDDRRQGWQDKIARSYVVHTWDARPDESFLMEYFVRNG